MNFYFENNTEYDLILNAFFRIGVEINEDSIFTAASKENVAHLLLVNSDRNCTGTAIAHTSADSVWLNRCRFCLCGVCTARFSRL